MKKFQERMDEIKVESYEDCVWYLKHIDKCKMCDISGVNLPCHCKEKMEDFCIWITKFFNFVPDDFAEVDEEDEAVAKKYLTLHENSEEEALYRTLINALK